MRITQHCIWSRKHHRNTKLSKRRLLQLTYHGSKPYKKKRTRRRLKPMSIQPFQDRMTFEMMMFMKGIDVRPKVQFFLLYQQLRC